MPNLWHTATTRGTRSSFRARLQEFFRDEAQRFELIFRDVGSITSWYPGTQSHGHMLRTKNRLHLHQSAEFSENRSSSTFTVVKTLFLSVLVASVMFSNTALADSNPELPASRRIHFVKKAATGNNNGSTWEHAFNFLQDALAVAKMGDEVWIAEGVYYPDEGNGLVAGVRSLSFEVIEGIRIIGGFSGDPQDYSRDHERYKSVLSGDLLKNDTVNGFEISDSISDNSLNVVRLLKNEACVDYQNSSCAIILDGLSITSGNANSHLFLPEAQVSAVFGGAVLTSSVREVHLLNLHLSSNRASHSGGAIFSQAELLICNNVSFEDNHSLVGGGAFKASGSATVTQFWNSSFVKNSSHLGGAIRVDFYPNPVAVINSMFLENTARDGGAISTYQTPIYITGSRFVRNYATLFGGAIEITKTIDPIWILNSEFIENECCNNTNDGLAGGGGIVFTESKAPNHIINSTFLNNKSGRIANTLYMLGRRVNTIVRNSILWNSDTSTDNEMIDMTEGTPLPLFENNILSEDLRKYVDNSQSNEFVDPEIIFSNGPDDEPYTIDDRIEQGKNSPTIDAGILEYLPRDTLDVDHDRDTTERIPLTVLNNERHIDTANVDGILDIGSTEYDNGSSTLSPPGSDQFFIYPNPSSGLITLDGQMCTETYLQAIILNLLGQELKRLQFFPGYDCRLETELYLTELPSGYYSIHVMNGLTSVHLPFVLIK